MEFGFYSFTMRGVDKLQPCDSVTVEYSAVEPFSVRHFPVLRFSAPSNCRRVNEAGRAAPMIERDDATDCPQMKYKLPFR